MKNILNQSTGKDKITISKDEIRVKYSEPSNIEVLHKIARKIEIEFDGVPYTVRVSVSFKYSKLKIQFGGENPRNFTKYLNEYI